MEEMTIADLNRVYHIWNTLRDKEMIELLKKDLDLEDSGFVKSLFNINTAQAKMLKQLLSGNVEQIYNNQESEIIQHRMCECIAETIHQDLEGWKDWEKVVIYRFLMDLEVYVITE